MQRITRKTRTGDESGFGLVEIVVAMFILGILAVAFLPMLIQGIKQSAINATRSSAYQFASQQVEIARAQTTCSGLTSYLAAAPTTLQLSDPRGIQLQASRSVDMTTCLSTASYPITIPVTTTVKRLDTGKVVISVSTRVLIEAYS